MQNKFLNDILLIQDIEDEIRDCRLPKVLLQPIVENSIKHGFTDTPGNYIMIKAYRTQIKQALLEETSEYQPENVMIAAIGIHNPSLILQLYSAPELDMLYQNFENTIAKIIADIKGFVIFRDGNNIILYLPFAPEQTQIEIMQLVSRLSVNMEKSLLSAISDLNLPKVNQCLEEIFSTITPTDKIDTLLNDLTSIAAKFYNEFGIPVQETLALSAVGRSPRKYLEWAKIYLLIWQNIAWNGPKSYFGRILLT